MLASYVEDIHWNTLVTNHMTILKVRLLPQEKRRAKDEWDKGAFAE